MLAQDTRARSTPSSPHRWGEVFGLLVRADVQDQVLGQNVADNAAANYF